MYKHHNAYQIDIYDTVYNIFLRKKKHTESFYNSDSLENSTQCVSVYQNNYFVLHCQPIALDKRTKNTLALFYKVAVHLQVNLHCTTVI